VYLNLGMVGLFLLVGVLFPCYGKIRKRLMLSTRSRMIERVNFDFDRFGMGYLMTYIIYNITEAGFRALNFVFVIFLIVAIEYWQPQTDTTRSSPARLPGAQKSPPFLDEWRYKPVK